MDELFGKESVLFFSLSRNRYPGNVVSPLTNGY